ncbi:hypothetical protein SK803_04175 [Lentzea sp. BCCO 10_0856]|uniref:Secreted protein n=1 Tax=Lentzea miocenica TaxID=3095431 RepID=A0ABU4SU37_9PSEU|nr:hypothetical protein [Lentzea sp. BCCO 10_0856]MDX8029391.1 hypothetical protein [Lentzea sp. BCCO 10_0856]
MKKISAMAAVAVAFAATLTATSAQAADFVSTADRISLQNFTQTAKARYGIDLNSADYKVSQSAGVRIIHRKDVPTPEASITKMPNGSTRVGARVQHTSPSGTEVEKLAAPGEVTVQQEVPWRQPSCFSLTDEEDPANIGDMLTCSAWARMSYPGESRFNWGYKVYGTCTHTNRINTYELDGCDVQTQQLTFAHSPKLYWNDWSPRGSVDLPNCDDRALSVGWGGVTAGHTTRVCERLNPYPGVDPGTMIAAWIGDAWNGESREVAFVEAFGAENTLAIEMYNEAYYFYSPCSLIPPSFDLCG